MEEVTKQYDQLLAEIKDVSDKLMLSQLKREYEELTRESQDDGFWNNSQTAQSKMKRLSILELRISPWQQLSQNLAELNELIELNDESLITDLETQLIKLSTKTGELKKMLKFVGPFDDHDAIVGIHAGAGGTDAQDWAQMLQRMYIRYAESNKMKVKLVQESIGEEAGIKSVTFEIIGESAYGHLKGEHGIHRLVRLSPYNSDNLRQTSFAKVEIMPKIDQPNEIEIDEKDLKIDVYRSGGHGGQSVNTTDSAVRVTHLPTGIVVAIQNERSQLQNKETAMTIIRSKLAQLKLEQHQDNLRQLKGPNEQAAWGNQIRSYVLHPYKQVKDLRTKYESSDVESVLNGDLDALIEAYEEFTLEHPN